jgi:glyoxylase-like metal-dependent hydrolase (beta-lactamase superfamily II)
MNIVNVGYDSTNYYVLGQNRPKLLVDVGFPGTLPKLLAILRRKDIPFQDIRYLLATHYHPDHAGLAQELKSQGVRLLVLEQQASAIPRLKSYMKPANRYVDITLHDNLDLTCAASRAFLKSIGIAGEIIGTPGHSDDSVTLVLDAGAAFTGDLLSPAVAGGDALADVTRSWERIRALGANMLYPGHGPVRPLETVLQTGG